MRVDRGQTQRFSLQTGPIFGVSPAKRPTHEIDGRVNSLEQQIHFLVDVRIIGAVNQCLSAGEQPEFFGYFLFLTGKPGIVRRSDIGKHADGGPNYWLQSSHFVGLRDTRFKNAERVGFVQLMHRQGYAHLGIVAFWTSGNHKIGGGRPSAQQLRQPLFYNGFAIAACNAHHRNLKLLPVFSRFLLKRLPHIIDYPKRCIDQQFPLVPPGRSLHHKLPYPALIQVRNVLMTIVSVAPNGKKNAVCGVGN